MITGLRLEFAGTIYSIDVDGTRYRFELPPYCGLCPTNKDGSGRMSPWPLAVWDAVGAWQAQGERVDDDVCVWEKPHA